MCGKSSRPGRRPARMNRELLTEVDSAKEANRRQKWGRAALEEWSRYLSVVGWNLESPNLSWS